MNAFEPCGTRPARGMIVRAAIVAGVSLFLAMLPVSAGVSIAENITLPSSWPSDVIVSVDSPGNGSSGVTATSSTMVSQTFTPTKDFTLDRLLMVYQLSTASATDSFTLRIQEVPEGDNADTYASGGNLLSADYLFDLASTGGVQKLLEFSFTGDDRLLLKAGATYAVEISSTVSSVAFFRRGADAYWGGRAYANRNALNYSGGTRDLVMAVAGDPDVITIEEAISPATAWPETVDINTCDPITLTSGVGLSPTSTISQTITPARDMKLDTLYFPYATTSASATDSFSLSIQEVPGGPGVQTYSAGTNLLGSSALVFSLASTGGVRNILRFGFGGENRITLKGGVTYAIELASNSSSATFYRRGASTYSGGAAYVNRSAINYPNTRDISSALVEGASAGYTYLPVPQSFSIQIVPGAGGNDEMAQDAEAGFKLARKGVYWYSTETSLGVYNFSSTDTIANNCAANGITPWFTLYGGNSLYGEANDSVLTASGRAGFANFAAATADRYPQVQYFEIWNEPNLLSFWTPQPSVDAYCALVAAAAPAIKAVNPNAKIVGPALNVIPLGWFESACRQGLLDHVDYVCVHPYRSGAPETVLSSYEDMRMLIRKYAPAGKRIEIISGEWGYSTSSQVNTTVQAQYAARMFLSSLSVGMPLTNWYTWKDSSDYFGLVDNNRNPKPSYNAIKTLTTLLNGYTFKERLPGPSDDVFLLKFMNDQSDVAYAVWTTGADVDVDLPIPADHGLLYSMYGDWQAATWGSSGPTITLTQSPQYLRIGEVAPVEVIVDNSDSSGVTLTGSWTTSTSTSGYYGTDYRHDGNTGKGTKSVLYTPTLTEAGTYEVFLRWTAGTNRASNVPVTIVHAGGSTQVQVDQRSNGGSWVSLGSYTFNTGTGGTVTLSNTGTDGYVIADAVKLSK